MPCPASAVTLYGSNLKFTSVIAGTYKLPQWSYYGILNYRIVGKFGEDLNLAIW